MKQPVSRIITIPGIQPRGGFLPPKKLSVESLCNHPETKYEELVVKLCRSGALSPQTLGLVFDYLLRVEILLSADIAVEESIQEAFYISLLGAKLADQAENAKALVGKLIRLYKNKRRDNKKIVQTASELVRFDAMLRAGYYDPNYQPIEVTDFDKDAIKLMVDTTRIYLMQNESLTSLGFCFSGVGSENVAGSDGDLLSKESLIDLKVSVKEPTSKHTLQLLLYYLLGLHEQPEQYKQLRYLKIINPRLGRVYFYETAKLDTEMLRKIEHDVMGYKNSVFDL